MIPHSIPSIGVEESQAIAEAINSGWIASGEKVNEFERVFAEYVGAKYAIAVNSGTSALMVALKVINADSVYLPTYCCAAVLNAVEQAEAEYYELKDVNRNDFNIGVNSMAQDDICAVIAVHTFGIPIKINYYMKPYIIEDCSQAIGSYVDGQHVGTQGDIGVFSFGPSKMITTGSGGMIVTNDKDLADKARNLIDYDKNIPAFNFGMNDIQAAMGIEQMKKLPEFLRKREVMAREYLKVCFIKGWGYQDISGGCLSNNYRFVIKTDSATEIIKHLAEHNITAIVPITKGELLHNMIFIDKNYYQNAEWIASHTVSLPMYPNLSDNEVETILSTLRSY
jgi:perosamine synthetase